MTLLQDLNLFFDFSLAIGLHYFQLSSIIKIQNHFIMQCFILDSILSPFHDAHIEQLSQFSMKMGSPTTKVIVMHRNTI